MMDGIAYLVELGYEDDSIGQKIPVEKSRRMIFTEIYSITRQEWKSAAQGGVKAQIMLKTDNINYSGEKVAEVDGKLYDIYRTYNPPGSDEIELYLEMKVGV